MAKFKQRTCQHITIKTRVPHVYSRLEGIVLNLTNHNYLGLLTHLRSVFYLITVIFTEIVLFNWNAPFSNIMAAEDDVIESWEDADTEVCACKCPL